MMRSSEHKRETRNVTVSSAERILMTAILWAAILGLAVIVTDYLLAIHA
jgi:hypothetical protein